LWSIQENMVFEAALGSAALGHADIEPFDLIAKCLQHKSTSAIKEKVGHLLGDVSSIESAAPWPGAKPEVAPLAGAEWREDTLPSAKVSLLGGGNSGAVALRCCTQYRGGPTYRAESVAAALDKKRERGTPWTEQEHKAFLVGLKEYGKGDWRSISRMCVKTRTPTQVASHAQKYFLRKQGTDQGRERRRVSIHDIHHVDSARTLQGRHAATSHLDTVLPRPATMRLREDMALGIPTTTCATTPICMAAEPRWGGGQGKLSWAPVMQLKQPRVSPDHQA